MMKVSAQPLVDYGAVLSAGTGSGVWSLDRERRTAALAAFARRGFDVRRQEEWKYADLKAITGGGFVPVDRTAADRTPAVDTAADRSRLVFVDGVLDAQASVLAPLPAGVTLRRLAAGDVPDELGTLADPDQSPLTALNGAFWTDGLVLDVGANVRLDRPVELIYRLTDAVDGGLVAVRNLVRVAVGGAVRIVERFEAAVTAVAMQAPVTEILCGAEARVDHVKIVTGSARGPQVGSTHVRQETGSVYNSREIVTAGQSVRREVHVDLVGSGASCDLRALYMGGERQRRDMRTRVRHGAADCRTEEVYKGVMSGRAQGVFDGQILVDRVAQQTAAHQTNRNLLLSDDAKIHSIPRLEIYADDVKCSHGSTTGSLDDEQLFYLRSRGFDTAQARVMLAHAFASEIIDSVGDSDLRSELIEDFATRLAASQALEEA